MPRRGRSTTIGKIAKVHHDRRVSEIRVLGERLRLEQRTFSTPLPMTTTSSGTPATR